MADRLSDADIKRLVAERKPLPHDYGERLKLKRKRGHSEREYDVTGAEGSRFRLILRQSQSNPGDFSLILAYLPPRSNQLFRLRRYNGNHGTHSNKLEGTRLDGVHIHLATERYQDSGFREDAFAEKMTRYSDYSGALRSILDECGFDVPATPRTGSLFKEDQ